MKITTTTKLQIRNAIKALDNKGVHLFQIDQDILTDLGRIINGTYLSKHYKTRALNLLNFHLKANDLEVIKF